MSALHQHFLQSTTAGIVESGVERTSVHVNLLKHIQINFITAHATKPPLGIKTAAHLLAPDFYQVICVTLDIRSMQKNANDTTFEVSCNAVPRHLALLVLRTM